jgi:hypothetical protein
MYNNLRHFRHLVTSVESRRPLTAENRVRSRVSLYVICSVQSGSGTGFSPNSLVFFRIPLVFLCKYYSTVALHIHISSGG